MKIFIMDANGNIFDVVLGMEICYNNICKWIS